MHLDVSILRCPIRKEPLQLVTNPARMSEYLEKAKHTFFQDKSIQSGLINASQTWFYPILEEVILLLPFYGIKLKPNEADPEMSFDKDRVFRYYNEINYQRVEEQSIYEDSAKWVDYRPVSEDYIRQSFLGARKYLNAGGQYYLDIASGPIGLPEYVSLSEGYDTRICMDISYRALRQAQYNFREKKGLYVCADITNIPLQEGVCDAVLSQHTLYHVPKDEQVTAVEELYRVCKPGGKVGIVYSWFYYSLLMDLTLFPVQLYRIARHVAGKWYVRLFRKKPRLYFYVHSPRWWRRFSFSDELQIFCWRTANKYFLNIYAHSGLGGRKLLSCLQKMEKRYPRIMGRLGDYPIIVISKNSKQ